MRTASERKRETEREGGRECERKRQEKERRETFRERKERKRDIYPRDALINTDDT